MEIEFSLSRADYIDFQLFAATKSETIKKNKRKARNRLPIIYFILGTILLILADKVFSIIFYLIAVLWYLLYPTLTKKRYARHYEKYVDENFKNRYDTLIKVSLSDNYELIETFDFEGESKFKTSVIEKIFEIKRFIYIKMKSGSHFIIPKYKIENIEKFSQELIIISKTKNFEVETDLEIDFNTDK
jgi:Ca2+/Na+ antiporter